MQALPVAMLIPMVQSRLALAGVLVDEALGPFAQHRLDEALGLAVGLRSVRSRELMADTQPHARLPEVPGPEGRTVIRLQLYRPSLPGPRGSSPRLAGTAPPGAFSHRTASPSMRCVHGSSMAMNSIFRPAPLTESRRLPFTRCAGRHMRPGFLVSICSILPGASCSQRTMGSTGCRFARRERPARASTCPAVLLETARAVAIRARVRRL